jgi:peroxiredoxin (alkyl hydroperoxide reductase subunit C)
MISKNNVNDPNNLNTISPVVERNQQCLTIGRIAPDFTAITTDGIITMSQYRGKWVLLFSHPGDFTPICTSEFIAFSQLYSEFVKRNVQLIGVSIDSNPAHLAWFYDILQFTGITIPFPLIADRDAEVSALYGMVNPDRIYEQSVRDVFIIDPNQRIRAILTYPATNGRNMYELLRLIDALQISTEYSVGTPANWMPGDPVIVPMPRTFNEVIERSTNPDPDWNCRQWYMCYTDYPGEAAGSTDPTTGGSAGDLTGGEPQGIIKED